MRRLTFRHVVLTLILTFGVITIWSIGSYVVAAEDGSVSQRIATWARNHHMGAIVDKLEEVRYSKPPSTKPADELGLNETVINADPTTATTIPETLTVVPVDISPVVTPALPNEGHWQPIVTANHQTVAWATSLRPLPSAASVVATYVVIDQASLVAGLFNGTELPGGGPWTNGSHVGNSALPSLILAFNGGFRFEHQDGGYYTEGKVVQPLVKGQASLAIDQNGHVTIGEYGRDLTNDGTWRSIRQNLPLIIDHGNSVLSKNPYVNWGEDYHDKIYVLRSAVCQHKSGSLTYAVVGDVNIKMLTQAMLLANCEKAMELDINGDWPQLATYTNPNTTKRTGIQIDKRMKNLNRYINRSSKDFVAFFDPVLLPSGIVK